MGFILSFGCCKGSQLTSVDLTVIYDEPFNAHEAQFGAIIVH